MVYLQLLCPLLSGAHWYHIQTHTSTTSWFQTSGIQPVDAESRNPWADLKFSLSSGAERNLFLNAMAYVSIRSGSSCLGLPLPTLLSTNPFADIVPSVGISHFKTYQSVWQLHVIGQLQVCLLRRRFSCSVMYTLEASFFAPINEPRGCDLYWHEPGCVTMDGMPYMCDVQDFSDCGVHVQLPCLVQQSW